MRALRWQNEARVPRRVVPPRVSSLPVPLVLIANRAPLRPTASGWAPAAGGLTTALLPVLDARGGAWVAMSEPGEDAPDVQEMPGGRATVYRVPLTEAEVEDYYLGMSNRVLWPLSHYLVDHVEPDRGFRDAYDAVNERFAQAALAGGRRSAGCTILGARLPPHARPGAPARGAARGAHRGVLAHPVAGARGVPHPALGP